MPARPSAQRYASAAGHRVAWIEERPDAGPPDETLYISGADRTSVTDRGVVAWRDDEVLFALVDGSVTELDRGGALTDSDAQGDTVIWTHDGAPRSFTPRG